MPRSTLPPYLSRLQTIDVVLTKTTEETIRSHMENMLVGTEESVDKFNSILDKLTQYYHDTNPYDKYTIQDWRNDRPKLKYKHDTMRWITDEGEEFGDEMMRLQQIRTDLFLCLRAFPEWRETMNVYYLEGVLFNTDELIIHERIRYNQSRDKYQKEDAEYILEKTKRIDHEYHVTREQYLRDDYIKRVMCYGKEPSYWTTCKWCIEAEKRNQDIKDFQKEEERLSRELEEEYRRNEAEKQQQLAKERKERTVYNCECCEFKTHNEETYEVHLGTREHTTNHHRHTWFCNECDTQCRSRNEYDFHIKSQKHRNKVNGVEAEEPTVFRCECCEYETRRKDHYKLHMSSKKHLSKSGSGFAS